MSLKKPKFSGEHLKNVSRGSRKGISSIISLKFNKSSLNESLYKKGY